MGKFKSYFGLKINGHQKINGSSRPSLKVSQMELQGHLATDCKAWIAKLSPSCPSALGPLTSVSMSYVNSSGKLGCFVCLLVSSLLVLANVPCAKAAAVLSLEDGAKDLVLLFLEDFVAEHVLTVLHD